MDEVLEVDFAELENFRTNFTLTRANLEQLLRLEMAAVRPPDTKLDIFARTFENQGKRGIFNARQESWNYLIVEVLVDLLETDRFDGVQILHDETERHRLN